MKRETPPLGGYPPATPTWGKGPSRGQRNGPFNVRIIKHMSKQERSAGASALQGRSLGQQAAYISQYSPGATSGLYSR